MNLDRIQDGKIYLHWPGYCIEYGLGRRYHSICDVCRSEGCEAGYTRVQIDTPPSQVDWHVDLGERQSDDVIYSVINTHIDIPISCLEQENVK